MAVGAPSRLLATCGRADEQRNSSFQLPTHTQPHRQQPVGQLMGAARLLNCSFGSERSDTKLLRSSGNLLTMGTSMMNLSAPLSWPIASGLVRSGRGPEAPSSGPGASPTAGGSSSSSAPLVEMGIVHGGSHFLARIWPRSRSQQVTRNKLIRPANWRSPSSLAGQPVAEQTRCSPG